MGKLLFVAVVALLGTACATGYGASGVTGGYTDTRLAPNVWRVSYSGNGYTSDARAVNFTMLRSAELALAHGFRYFVVAESRDTGTSDTRLFVNKYSAQTQTHHYPGQNQTIVCFAEQPEGKGLVYDAAFVRESIAKEYELELAPIAPSTEATASAP